MANESRKRILECVMDIGKLPELIKLDHFFNEISTYHTTSHAIGELSGLVNARLALSDEQKKEFWDSSIMYLRTKQFNEDHISLLKLHGNSIYTESFNNTGFVDTGLIQLAKVTHQPIITNDERTMGKYAKYLNADVLVIKKDIWMYI